MGLILARGTKILHAMWHSQKKKKGVQDIKCTTDSKWSFGSLCIIGYKSYPIYGILSWHLTQSKFPIFNIPLFLIAPKKKKKERHKRTRKLFTTATWMGLDIVILSNVRQSKTNTIWYHLHEESLKMVQINLFTKQK